MEKQYLEHLKAYVSAWNESSEVKIKQAVADCVAPHVRYCDPFTDVSEGIEPLVKIMNSVSQNFPGIIHELVGEPAIHHNFGYYHWLARMDSDKTIPGIDYVEFGPEGTIARVVSFTNMADWQ